MSGIYDYVPIKREIFPIYTLFYVIFIHNFFCPV
jgi:hypothetical protein